MSVFSYKSMAFGFAILFLGFFITSCSSIHDGADVSEQEEFFSTFSNFKQGSANFRVGTETDTFMYHFKIKALTTAQYTDEKYFPHTIYILKHQSGDSLVIETSDFPLLSHHDFKRFHIENESRLHADTIVNSHILDQFFFIQHSDAIEVESFEEFPFLFLDVNFNGYPALLVRKKVDSSPSGDYYKYNVYGINENGFHKVDFEPYLSIKNRTNTWCFGGSTKFDYKNKTITVYSLSTESCSDYGTQITDIYRLNEVTDKFDKSQIKSNYDFD